MRRQGSPVSIGVVMGSASLLSSHGRTRAWRRVEEGLSRSFSGCRGKPSFASTSSGDLRELPRVPLRGEAYCGVGGAFGTPLGLAQWKRASSRGEAGTSDFLSVSDSDRRVPAELGQESQASSCLRKGTPLASRVAQGSQAPRRAVCGTRGSLRTMHGGGSAPSCCAFTHRVAFEEGSGPRVHLKSGPGNRGRSACGPTHVARLEFPRETGLILRCAGKAGNPFQTTQGNCLSCCDQEGRRGSEEAVPGP